MSRRRSKRLFGFSLLEVMISSSLLLGGITATVVGVSVALALHEHERKVSRALLISEKRMESLLVLIKGSADLNVGRHPENGFERFDLNGRPSDDPKAPFRVFYVISAKTGGSIGAGIDVTVLWDERLGERSITLTTVR